MKKIWKALTSVITGILIIALIFGAGFLTGKNYGKNAESVTPSAGNEFDLQLPGEVEKRVVTVSEIESKLVEIGELASYSGTPIGSMSLSKQLIENYLRQPRKAV